MNKKIKIILIGILGLVIITVLFMNISIESSKVIENSNIYISEISPAEEISNEIDYNTTIKLYFPDAISGVMLYEERKVDARELIDNPYKYVVELLIKGPESTELKNDIPEGTKINKVYLEDGSLVVDLSEEFLNSQGMNSIYSIVNTVYEFNEVENVKFLIQGETRDGLKEKYVKNK